MHGIQSVSQSVQYFAHGILSPLTANISFNFIQIYPINKHVVNAFCKMTMLAAVRFTDECDANWPYKMVITVEPTRDYIATSLLNVFILLLSRNGV